jgi:putative transposase
MYDYRRMNPEERKRILKGRQIKGFPWHAPPHFGGKKNTFLITGACYDHRPILSSPDRLTEFSEAFLRGIHNVLGASVQAWVIQPNHYHVLLSVDLDILRPWIGRLHNGKSTQWNREDGTPKRKVWHRFSDRGIRSEGHYYATLNYIHANPVKHGYVEHASDWPWSSLHEYIEEYGRDMLLKWWRNYPIGDYGKGWDDWQQDTQPANA